MKPLVKLIHNPSTDLDALLDECKRQFWHARDMLVKHDYVTDARVSPWWIVQRDALDAILKICKLLGKVPDREIYDPLTKFQKTFETRKTL